MSKFSKRKLIADLKSLNQEGSRKIFSSPFETNLFFWKSIILGPYLTPMNNGVFKLFLEFSNNYPNSPPKVKMIKEKPFHPNIYVNGQICLDILQKKWSPGFSLETILTSIQCLLGDPNTESPAYLAASELYVTNRFEYYRKVVKVSKKSWRFS
ncbi:ubc2 (nucleomorph) [Hemiselmis andersenii]|uniref:Ubc2 n=1 Tax=Hemiselmis andersenii TaxID=464988 RepID=A9BKT3_HEMAN|nr:ubc2 [Hemiselmis andersenii]ABW98088.1 ubc2 [Hemiselmis andersenii]|mmetsp:Transcript_12616/g.29488  ORF Transcript_12616/g.29488 Transcript_12616/m.29488 type:complete len:154 (-) Transcript_12616:541-1002(-)